MGFRSHHVPELANDESGLFVFAFYFDEAQDPQGLFPRHPLLDAPPQPSSSTFSHLQGVGEATTQRRGEAGMPWRRTRGSLRSSSCLRRKPPRAPQLEETPETPPSSRAEGLLFLHDVVRIQGQSLGPSRFFPSLLISFSGRLSS